MNEQVAETIRLAQRKEAARRETALVSASQRLAELEASQG